MKIFFLWDWNPTMEYALAWQDGLAAALQELSKRGHELIIVIPSDVTGVIKHPYFEIITGDVIKLIHDFAPDVVLEFGDMTRPHAKPIKELGIPTALCFAGGEPLAKNLEYFDHVFVESQVYEDIFKDHISVSRAFGTNTELFKPMDEQPKMFDTIFPATFARWKRHQLYAEATKGLRSLAVGLMQIDNEPECWQVCLDHGVMVMPHTPMEALHYLYAASEICVVTSDSTGGSQRTVLEAMSMDLPVIVTDSDKFDFIKNVFECAPKAEEIRGCINAILDGDHEMNTRQYVVDNWSEFSYADSLEVGLSKLLS